MTNDGRATRCLPTLLLALLVMAWPAAGRAQTAGAASTQARVADLGASGRVALTARMAAWDALPLAEREQRRARYLAWRALPESERYGLAALAVEMSGFDPLRLQALRQQFDAQEARAQDGWRLGPALGADYPSLYPLLAYVPPAQREPLLGVLRRMPAAERADLAVLVQRTPPQDRQALRKALVSLPAHGRWAWLRQRLAD